jgi:hypothetical protein
MIMHAAGSLYKVHDTHKVRYLDGSAPDITVTQMGFDAGSFNAVMVVELQVGWNRTRVIQEQWDSA